MKKMLCALTIITITFTAACSKEKSIPVSEMNVHTSTIHMQGNDIIFQYGGDMYRAADQKAVYEKQKAAEYLTFIKMSDGQVIIQQNDAPAPAAVSNNQQNNAANNQNNKIPADEKYNRERNEQRVQHQRDLEDREMTLKEKKQQLNEDYQRHKMKLEEKASEKK
ncbi:hypothetical protein SB724_19170 [Bacillus sp. SIMBA_031]|uniref:hypothetical protein n=4 Tax=Bacteria TaxID=2 RepID=UPI0039792FE3